MLAMQVRTAAWHQNDQLLLTAYIDQPGVRRVPATVSAPLFTRTGLLVHMRRHPLFTRMCVLVFMLGDVGKAQPLMQGVSDA